MHLAVNFGNTNTYFATFEKPGHLIEKWSFETKKLLEDRFFFSYLNDLPSYQNYEKIGFASVVPRISGGFNFSDNPRNQNSKWKWITLESSEFRVKHQYDGKLGIDRLLAAETVFREYGCPALFIDTGTATTFNVIDRKESGGPFFRGGAILPGLNLVKQALSSRIEALSGFPFQSFVPVIGNSTKDGLMSGIQRGHAFSIEGFISEVKKEPQFHSCPVILTGGASHWIAKLMSSVTHTDPDLVLKGISYVYDSV